MDVNALLSRIKALEEKQKPSISDLKKNIVQYALRPLNDFDKYKAIDLIEQLKNVSVQIKDKKADYYTTVYSALMEKLVKPAEHFRNYILSLLGDRDYEKVIEAVLKIDKALEKDLTPSSFSNSDVSNSDVSPSFVPPYYNPLPHVSFPPLYVFHLYNLPLILRRCGSSRFCTFVTDGATLIGTVLQKGRMIVENLIMVLSKNNFTLSFEI